MSCGIVRVQKMSSGSVGGIETHDRRKKEGISHTNQDIDWTSSNQNYDLHPAQNESFTRAVKERIAQLELPKAVRKDAVVMAQILVTSDHGFFDNLSPAQTKQFFEDSYKFLTERYGQENVISATVHMDERTPHLHFNFIPVTLDGRLSAKSLLTRQSLIEQQDKFHEIVGKKHGLDRGERGGQKKHLDVMSYKVATKAQEVDRLENVKEQLEQEKATLQGQLEGLQKKIDLQGQFIQQISQIPRGKKTMLGKVEFTAKEAEALIKTCETVYDTRNTAKKAIDHAEQMKAYVGKLEASVSANELFKLKELNLELKNEIYSLKAELKANDRTFDKIDKVFAKYPDIGEAFFSAKKVMEKEMSLELSR